MTIYRDVAEEFENTLGLKSCLIGVRYDDKPDPRGDAERKLAACEAIDVARREKAVVNLSAESCNYTGGKYYLGLAPVPKSRLSGWSWMFIKCSPRNGWLSAS